MSGRQAIVVSAPSRLHFGLLSFGGRGRQFGGVGAMIQNPRLQLRVTHCERFEACGAAADRVHAFAQRWASFHRRPLPGCRLRVERLPPQHVGLGSGTQLGLATAAALCVFCGLPVGSPSELAMSVQRGLRSAVGTYGFLSGGLIVERGKLPSEPLSPLDCRVELPEPWRFVLLRPKPVVGLSGASEQRAFDELPATPPSLTQALQAELRERLLPAAASGAFDDFAASLQRYGRMAGQCFSPVQGGPYNGPALQQWVARVLEMGGVGVGQSSWGPTLFCVQPNEAAAERFAERLRATTEPDALQVSVTGVDNRGFQIASRALPIAKLA